MLANVLLYGSDVYEKGIEKEIIKTTITYLSISAECFVFTDLKPQSLIAK